MLNQIIDGFTMNSYVRQNPYDFRALAMGQLETLRRAKSYRPRIYAVPDLDTPVIGATDTLQKQITMREGTYIWGISAVLLYGTSQAFNGNNTTSALIGLTHFFVRDDGTGIPLFDDFIGDYILSPTDFSPPGSYGGAAPFTAGLTGNVNCSMQPTLLAQPRLVMDPGLITVMISNTTSFLSAANIRSQILLHCAEPCEMLAQECDPCNS